MGQKLLIFFVIPILVFAGLISNVSFAEETEQQEIPKKIQKKILAANPEIDSNKDGKVSVEELKAGMDKLPKKSQKKIKKYLPKEEN